MRRQAQTSLTQAKPRVSHLFFSPVWNSCFYKVVFFFLVEKNFLFNENTFETKKKGKKGEIFRIPAYAVLFCRNNEFVKKKQVLAQFSSVLKKMQYGRAEQTLYSMSAGEFVFGKSFLFDGNDFFADHGIQCKCPLTSHGEAPSV